MLRKGLRRRLAVLWIALVAACALAVNAYLALRPAAIEARVRFELARVLAAPFELSSFDWSFSRGAEVRGFKLYSVPRGQEGSKEVLSAESIVVRPDFLGVLRGRFEASQVVIEAPRLHLSRSADGGWSFDGLLAPSPAAAQPEQGTGNAVASLPPVLIEAGRLTFDDARTFASPVTEVVDEVYARLEREKDGSLRFKAEARPAFARKLEASGTLGTAGGSPVLRMEASARKIDLSALEKFLPAEAAAEARSLKLRGFADLLASFKVDEKEGLVPIQVALKVLRAEVSPPYLHDPVKGLEGTCVVTERAAELRDFHGSLGGAKVSFSGRAEVPVPWISGSGFARPARWTLQAGVDSFLLDARFRDALPPGVRKALEEYRVEGPVGLDVRVLESRSFPPRPEDVSATLRLEGVDFVYHLFPYVVRDLHGEVSIEKGRISFAKALQGRDGPMVYSVSGKGAELTPDGEIEVVIKYADVPIDERLRAAMPRLAHDIWDDFQLAGTGDTTIVIQRERALRGPPGPGPDAATPEPVAPRVVVEVRPKGIRMSYRKFPYEIRGITGRIVFDTGAERLTFEGLKGMHGEQTILGDGVVELELKKKAHSEAPAAGRLVSPYRIDLRSDSLAVDEELVAALSDEGKRLLSEFNFKGRVKTAVSIHSTERAESSVVVDVDLIDASVRHDRFPYTLELGAGNMRFEGQTLTFTGVSTVQGFVPAVVFKGSMLYRGTTRTLDFDLDLKSLKFDDNLVDALAPSLASFVTRMHLGGVYDGRVTGIYLFDEVDPTKLSIEYEGTGITARGASVDFGLAIREMTAAGKFHGGFAPDRANWLVGDVQVASGWFNRLHLTKGEIDFALGVELDAVRMAREGKTVQGREYLPPREMLDRLVSGKVNETFQMLVHSSDMYGGVVDGLLYVDTGAQRDLGGDFVGKGFEVAKAAGDVFGASGTGTSGVAGGKFRFTGRAGEFLSITGNGQGAIEKARLVELPLFLGILSGLFGEGSSRHYFNEVLLKFDIKDGLFRASSSDGIDIRSTGVKLLGGGTMDFAGNLDLTLEPRILDLKIPIVDQILSFVKKGLAQVQIRGDLAKPDVKFVTGGFVRIGIDAGSTNAAPLPSDLRGEDAGKEKDLPPGAKGR